MNNTKVKNLGFALLLLVWMLPGYGEPAIAFTCGAEHIISDDGIFNPYEVQLAELHRVTSAPLPPAQAQSESYPIPPENFCSQEEAVVAATVDRDASEPQKISPVLKRWLDEESGSELREIIVQFNDDLQIPRLPVFDTSVPPGEALDKRQRAILDVKHKRSLAQARYLAKLKSQVRFKHTGSFWLVNAVTGKVRLDKVRRIARMQFVTYLQPAVSGEPPPSNENPDDDVEDGRAAINSAAYFDMNLAEGRIGLIDTGVAKSHAVFSPENHPENHLGRLLDCVNGGPTCADHTMPQFNSGDVAGHGTSTAAILMGGTALGPEFRGVTGVKTDSWRVYEGQYGRELHSATVLRALERGVQYGIDLWVMQVQEQECEQGAIAGAADSAYETGSLIIAANGNAGTVRSPAIAHKVIGVGGFHVVSKQTLIAQSRGPAPDNRYKPDIQGPSYTETAHGINNTDLWVYKDTSGATPYVGSAAMLARNWLKLNGVAENGQVYAFVILYGQQPLTSNDDLHNEVGAGSMVMATDGRAWWGKTVVGHGMTIDIPLIIGTNMQDFDIALWWPESAMQEHSDINAFAIDPQGAISASSQGKYSVFERAAVAGNLESGTWKLQIRGNNVPQGQQLVYWAAVVKNG